MTSYSFRSRRSVAWAAFRSGGLSSCVLRPSSGSPSRWVVVCRFHTMAAAAQFARVAAQFSGCPISVKECMSVSVPVFVRSSHPVGVARPVSAVGGLRVFAASLKSAGWVSLRW